MKSKLMLFLVALSFTCFAEVEGEIKGKVVNVIDGNTIEITSTEGEKYKILLHGIDSPDPGQNFAENARTFLAKMLQDRNVTIVIRGKDRQGNRLGDIRVDGADPEREMVRQGFAWTTEQDAELESLKEHAREMGIGLWADEHPIPPWMFRRQQSMAQAKSS